jgi:soluble lytic murein transglycosylase-like protein
MEGARADVIAVGPSGISLLSRPAGSGGTVADPGAIARTSPEPPLPPAIERRLEVVRGPLEAASVIAEVSPALLEAVAYAESAFDATAMSPAGAIGLMQLMPGTADEIGVDPYELSGNARGGGLYLRRMLDRFDGDLTLALAAYNAGPGTVDRYGGAPPWRETSAYVAKVLDYLSAKLTPGDRP